MGVGKANLSVRGEHLALGGRERRLAADLVEIDISRMCVCVLHFITESFPAANHGIHVMSSASNDAPKREPELLLQLLEECSNFLTKGNNINVHDKTSFLAVRKFDQAHIIDLQL